MKNGSVTMGVAALLLAGAIQAQDITDQMAGNSRKISRSHWLSTQSGFGRIPEYVVTIAGTSTGLSAIEDDLGPTSLSLPPR